MTNCKEITLTLEEFNDLHYNKKHTLKELSEILGIESNRLSEYIRNVLGGVIVRQVKHKRYRAIPQVIRDSIIFKFTSGVSVCSLMEEHSLSRPAITYVLKENNIKILEQKHLNQSINTKNVTRRTHEEYVSLCLDRNIEVLEKYIGVDCKILHNCLVCSNKWSTCPGTIITNGAGCPKCGIKKAARSRSSPPEKYVKKLAELCPNLEVLEDYINYSAKILHRCKTCGFTWKTRPILKKTKSGCRECSKPSGGPMYGKKVTVDGITFDSLIEFAVYSELIELFIPEEISHKKWYVGGKLTSDFYIPKLDLWIEVSRFNNQEYLEKIHTKRNLVKNFVFFTNIDQVKDYFDETWGITCKTTM